MLLQAEAAGLAVLTLVLAGPASAWLARARWPVRSPRAALFLWQAVGLGCGLGILTAGLTLAAAAMDPHWIAGITAVPGHWSRLTAAGWFGVGLTGCVGAWLVTMTTASGVRVLAARRSHRRRLDLIADVLAVEPAGRGGTALAVRLVDDPHALAYCLPGLRSRVVLSRGALRTLSEPELAAVLAHEQAHARGRHDLVTQPFVAWGQTFPFLPTARQSVAAVSLLVEMLADDAALRRCVPADLAGALCRLGDAHPAVGSGDADLRRQLAARLSRLRSPARPLTRRTTALIYGGAAALVLVPPLILLCS